MNLGKLPSNLKENVLLSDYSTFKIGGVARYFLAVRSEEELKNAVVAARKNKLRFLVLGGGSNVLFPDKGYNGLVIKNEILGLYFDSIGMEVSSGAGVKLCDLVKLAKKEGIAGFEWMTGIPGTVGGAIFGNAQAFLRRTSDIVKKVEVFDAKDLKFKTYQNKACKFGVKNSIFKKKSNLIIVSAIFTASKGKTIEIEEKTKEFLSHRRKNHPIKFPSAGSVFVNPVGKIKNKRIVKEFPEIEEMNKNGVIHAGYLIEKCGLKGKKMGGAQISPLHGNFIVNIGGAKAGDVIKLVKLAKTKVKAKFGITLKEEIRIMK